MHSLSQLAEGVVGTFAMSLAQAGDVIPTDFVSIVTGPGGALALAGLWLWVSTTGRQISKSTHDERIKAERERADAAEAARKANEEEIKRLNELWVADVVPALIRFSDAEVQRIRGRGADAQ